MGHLVTGLCQQKRNPRRVNLYLDGAFALSLSLEVVQDFGLRRGLELTDADVEALRRAEEKQQALRDAVRFLSYRPRSEAEVEQYLRRRGQDEETVQSVLSRLIEAGLVDDRAFARAWVEARQATGPRGQRALRAELLCKGVPRTVVDEVLVEALADLDEAEQALRVARTRAAFLAGLDRAAFVRRLRAYLLRRGFSPEAADTAVRRVWSEKSAASLETEAV
ncbi:MAG: RecX family transcriptional regulator [Chloroflexia bacterium]